MSLRDGLQSHPTVRQRYDALVAGASLKSDPAQLDVVGALDRLLSEITLSQVATKSSALGWLFARKRQSTTIKGLYIYGGVGRGKTMLMDMFFDVLPVRRKRRAHFIEFMADVHDRIARHRQARREGTVREDDPIPPVARALAEQAWVLCFDEFSVTDIADAMILSRLFSALFEQGVVLVATSNVAPQNLYPDGLNRQLFLPFVGILERHVDVLSLDTNTDYRLEKTHRTALYLTPLNDQTDRNMDDIWTRLSAGQTAAPATLNVKGHTVDIPTAASGMARFSFSDLCDRPLAARDYLAIADRYATIMIDHIPVLEASQRNQAKRLILLIDVLYDNQIRLIVSAASSPEELFRGRPGSTEAFEFDRTASRLIEMQSRDWIEAWNERQASAA